MKTRREARFEKFGPPRDPPPPREPREREDRPRSSRFGRVPREDDAPSRLHDRNGKPIQPWEGRGRGAEEKGQHWKTKPRSEWALAGHGRLNSDGMPVREDIREGLGDRGERAPRPERFGGGREERSFEGGRRFDKPGTPYGDRPARDFGWDKRGGERREFNRNDGTGERRAFSRDDSGGGRGTLSRDDRGGERWQVNRDDRGGERRTFSRDDRGSDRRDFNKDDRGAGRREFSKDFSERSERFPRRDDDAPPSTLRLRDATEERPREARFTHRADSKGARREGERNGRDESDAPSSDQRPFVRGPESLPYTTAASEFIYGHSSVLAAIKANRRKFYKLYVHSRGASRDGLMSRIRAHKLFSITQEVGDEYMRALDKASSGRPHNGVILESSPLPVPPITELKTANVHDESFSVGLDSQSAEDLLVNGKQELFSYKSGGWRHPLILYVDGVVSRPLTLTPSPPPN
jgi:21S rRNA (GM2251-2'-O)-methyltransferase